jgi:hypothetical protein
VALWSFASISSVTNWIGEYGRFLLLFPEVEVTASLGLQRAAENTRAFGSTSLLGTAPPLAFG